VGLDGIFLYSAKLLSQTKTLPHLKVPGLKNDETVAHYNNVIVITPQILMSSKSITFFAVRLSRPPGGSPLDQSLANAKFRPSVRK
jgi:hypothetical protein